MKEEYPPLRETNVKQQQIAQKHPQPNSEVFSLVQFQTGIFFILPFSIASLAMKCGFFRFHWYKDLISEGWSLFLLYKSWVFCKVPKDGEIKASGNLHILSKSGSSVVSLHHSKLTFQSQMSVSKDALDPCDGFFAACLQTSTLGCSEPV